MPLAVNDIISVIYRTEWQEQRYLLTTTWRVSATNSDQTDVQDLVTIAQQMGTRIGNNPMVKYNDMSASDVLFVDTRAQRIHPVRSVFRQQAAGFFGAAANSAATGNIAGVATLTTAKAGRSQISNKHVGPIPDTFYANGKLTLAYRDALIDLAQALATPQAIPVPGPLEITLQPVIWHRVSTTSDDVISFKTSDRVGTMRSRTLRVGE